MANVVLQNIGKSYGSNRVLDDINLQFKDGEFVVLIGPSGCGKSTLLRMIAGLEGITSGSMIIDGTTVNGLEARERDIAMVFQSYALYPHLSVAKNIGFPLRIRNLDADEIDSEVKRVAAMIGLLDLLERKPAALSGGQRQRVAMGRAIIRSPKVFLFDEPLSNLDAKLRVQMRLQIRDLHREVGATSVYVTHDQIEAMTLADRVVLLHDGDVQQVGTPLELYERPVNTFVAGFIGSPEMNLIEGQISSHGSATVFQLTQGNSIDVPKQIAEQIGIDRPVILGIRPEHLHPADKGLKANFRDSELLGSETRVFASIGDKLLTGVGSGSLHFEPGEQIFLKPETERLHFFDPVSQLRIGA